MSTVRKPLAYSAVVSYVALVLQNVSTGVITRILAPTQTGVFAVAAVFASLASTVRDFGVAEYLVQEQQLDAGAIRAALTLNLAISWLIVLLLVGFAPRRSVSVSTFTGAPLMLGQASGPFTESTYIVGGTLRAAASVIAWLAALRCTGHPLWPELQRMLPTAAARRPGP